MMDKFSNYKELKSKSKIILKKRTSPLDLLSPDEYVMFEKKQFDRDTGDETETSISRVTLKNIDGRILAVAQQRVDLTDQLEDLEQLKADWLALVGEKS